VAKIALAAAVLATAICVGTAASSGQALYPHLYRAKITRSKIGLLNATWLLSIQKTVFGLKRNGGTAVVGSVAIAGNRITFHDIGAPLACHGAQVNGSYTWRVVGTKLTFTRLNDACIGRRSVLAFPFTRIS
jgi:hypothetical protein